MTTVAASLMVEGEEGDFTPSERSYAPSERNSERSSSPVYGDETPLRSGSDDAGEQTRPWRPPPARSRPPDNGGPRPKRKKQFIEMSSYVPRPRANCREHPALTYIGGPGGSDDGTDDSTSSQGIGWRQDPMLLESRRSNVRQSRADWRQSRPGWRPPAPTKPPPKPAGANAKCRGCWY
ncbi:hypothetical protein M885DRAFT_513228 [Pelagophyceae sp. CCMP2097]|nr:hypothetical protein M885DRAFT_513228 [Pelagophyceae sp. CCMP2097]|mmetsp:Transcript_23230/g.79307  ORF Transcript_23230/g.79307 Transcript_23230/m.79307 type:complete len:179 (-) Transcript_23230:53-589(-)